MDPKTTDTPQPPGQELRSEDLLTAGLGLAGLADPKAPVVTADAAGRRVLAYHANWRGIADLSAAGGFGTLYGSFAPVPGIEVKTWIGEVGLTQPHGVMVHVPDSFDPTRPCLVVAPVSGSRGIYGALATAGAWALANRCAVVYTDKGAGTGFFDLDGMVGIGIDGAPVRTIGEAGFVVDAAMPVAGGPVRGIAIKHAHSKDHAEAHWGRMTLSAARFALLVLEQRYPGRRFRADNTRVIAASISNGGGAVLRALEEDRAGLIDAVVAAAPQLSVEGVPSLLDYATRAALLAPCAQLVPELANAPLAPLLLTRRAEFEARCRTLAQTGMVEGTDLPMQARSAYAQLRALGLPEAALMGNATNVAADLWRAVAVTYTQAYARAGADEQLCGFRFAMLGPDGQPRAASAADHAAWFASSSGIAPTAGVQIIGPPGEGPDPHYAGLRCLREAYLDGGALGQRIRLGERELRASASLPTRPVVIIHGREDALIPVGASSRPYVERALRLGAAQLHYWEIEHAQHFDAFLMQPAYAARHVPLLPYFQQALDQVLAHLDGGPAPAPSQVVRSRRRGDAADGGIVPLTRVHLGELRADPGADAIALDGERLRVPL
ncbi:MAG: D-(-)-3-hydroxybutyrate oligomer hydrolase [Xanthomonadales bacterium]|nr:D-(-)-3-hydroxybutyrate oligomer hydrolase [Xanthomonadales bacterium]